MDLLCYDARIAARHYINNGGENETKRQRVCC